MKRGAMDTIDGGKGIQGIDESRQGLGNWLNHDSPGITERMPGDQRNLYTKGNPLWPNGQIKVK